MDITFHLAVTFHFLIRLLLLAFLSFFVYMLITPIYTYFAYRNHWWKKQRTNAWSGGEATVYNKLHAEKHKRSIPTMAGMIFIIVISVIVIIYDLNKNQTWLPLAGLVLAGLVGLVDDAMNVKSHGGVAGMGSKLKFILYSAVALLAGGWFYFEMHIHAIYLPFVGNVPLGFLIIPVFWFIVMATSNSVNITDGLDGLAGGLLTTSFAAYSIICVVEHQYFLAIFCFIVVGALLGYTWFNIFPARFYMGDSGAFALGTALGIIGMQTNTIYVLPIIGIIYVAETGSVIINRLSKKIRHGKKVFLSSPIHHHFEAIGWPETKVTMRFWVIGQVAAAIGLFVFLIVTIK